MKPTHSEIAADVAAFLAAGGKVTVGSTYKPRKMAAPARGSQRSYGKWSAPVSRPAVMWDAIPTKR